MAVHQRGAPRYGDEHTEVLDLSLDRVWRGVAAVAAAATVVVDHVETLRQLLGQRPDHRLVARRSTHHDDRWSITQPVDRDGSAVFRTYFLYNLPISRAISDRSSNWCPRPSNSRTVARGSFSA
jgi:hypothetical protein